MGGKKINILTAEIACSAEKDVNEKIGPPVHQYPGIWGSPEETLS